MGYYEPRWSTQIIDESALVPFVDVARRRLLEFRWRPTRTPLRAALRTEPMDEPNLPASPDADDASAELKQAREAGLDELVRASEEAGLYDDEVTATRLRR